MRCVSVVVSCFPYQCETCHSALSYSAILNEKSSSYSTTFSSPYYQSDMYSMGVILLELFQPFGTEMERTEVLTQLRNGQIPHTFYKTWPIQAKYVKLLTSQSSTERPTAAQLRDSELFHTPEHVSYISNLNRYSIKAMLFLCLCCFEAVWWRL